jgi:hypothetical protein
MTDPIPSTATITVSRGFVDLATETIAALRRALQASDGGWSAN